MSDEQNSWLKSTLGIDVGAVVDKVKDTASAVVEQVENKVVTVAKEVEGAVQGGVAAVEGAIGAVSKAAGGIVQKVDSALSPSNASVSGPQGATSGGTGSFPLHGSVGQRGKNGSGDVRAVQTALGLTASGQCDVQTIAAIKEFQRNMGRAKADGRVDPGGPTEKALANGGGGSGSSLFDRALGSVSGAVDSVEDAGKPLLQTGEDLVNKGAAELRQGYDAASDTLGNISLSDLPLVNDISGGKASVVANPNVPPALQGGGTASAGDSRFVAGDDDFFAKSGYVSSLSAHASSLRNAAKGIQQAEDAVEKMAKDHSFFSSDDKQLLANAKNLKGVADGMLKLAGEIDKWTGDTNKLSIKKGDEVLGHADKLLQAADTVIAIKDLSGELNAFQQKPNADTARAWARGVGKAFDSASALIPSKGLPGFIPDLWKGLLSAPKNYIEAFITLMDVHDKTITEATDFDPDQHQTSDSGKHLTGKRTGWKGELTDIYYRGAFVPNLKDDNKSFLTFMLDHVTSEGSDLWTVKKAVGKAILLAAINRDVPGQDAKDVWLAHVGNG